MPKRFGETAEAGILGNAGLRGGKAVRHWGKLKGGVYMDIIIEEILSAIFDGLLHGKKVPKAVKYIISTLLYGFIIVIFALCAISAAKDNIPFMVCCIVLTVIFTAFYVKLLIKIHRNEMNDDDL